VAGLLFKGIGGVVDGDGGIGFRIVFHGVDAVEDARERTGAGAEQAVQALAVVGGLYLLRVGGADGGDVVGKDDAALDERTHAVELKAVGGVGQFAQRNHFLNVVDLEQALILEVVDGKDGLDVLVLLQFAILYIQHRRDEARLPVVAVDDVGHEVDQRQALEHGAAEVGEALALVGAVAVDVVAAEVLLVVDEVEGDPLIDEL